MAAQVLSGIQHNCRSINTGLTELKLLIYNVRPDFVALSETWLNVNSKYIPKFINYSAEWVNRQTSTGGGLGILVKKGIIYRNINLNPFNNGVMEVQCIEILLSNHEYLKILNIYNPNKNITLGEMNHYIHQLGDKFIFIGDFNAHSILFSSRTTTANSTGRTIENLLQQEPICLNTPNNFYTYMAPNGSMSVLDLCFSSPNLAPFISLKQLKDIGSDHFPIQINIQVQPEIIETQFRKKWKYNEDKLNEFGNNLDNCTIPKPNSIANLVEDLTNRIWNSANNFIGQTSGKPRVGKRIPGWDQEASKAIAERRKARKTLERSPTSTNVEIYQNKFSIAQKLVKEKKDKAWQDFISSINHTMPISTIWKKIQSIKGYNYQFSYPIKRNGELVLDPYMKANLFAEYYQNIAPVPRNSTPNINQTFTIESDSPEQYNKDITLHELESVIRNVKESSPGVDQITYTLLKHLKPEHISEILDLYNCCFNLGIFPKEWKRGLILPILKPNRPSDEISSYRPITLLPALGKIFERVLQRRLEYVLEKNFKLNDFQCGFRREHSTLDVLLRLENKIQSALNSNKVCVLVYVDYKSAFDTVSHRGTLEKLAQLGIKGKLFQIISNFLKDRKIAVSINNTQSDTKQVYAGTPQGAVLSPLLFNIALNDIPQESGIEIFAYADDITIACTGDNMPEVKNRMQNYLKIFDRWSEESGLIVNTSKTYIQYYTRKAANYPALRIKNRLLEYKKTCRVLGMIFESPKLSWLPHIEMLKRDCTKRIDIMKTLSSSVWGATSKVLRTFYIAYIRAKIDYGSIIYSSATENQLSKLEVIQNQALRLILGARRTTPILSLQAESHIPPLKIHRAYLHMKQFSKLKYKPLSSQTTQLIGLEQENANNQMNIFKHRAKGWLSKLDILIKRRPLQNVPVIPPWITVAPYIVYNKDKSVHHVAFRDYLYHSFNGYIQIYCDGSKTCGGGEASVACASYSLQDKTTTCWKLRGEHSVLSSELFAIYKSLQSVKSSFNHVIFTDSLSALELISKQRPETYIQIVYHIQQLLLNLNQNQIVLLHWVKAHNGIFGNEIADRAANLGHGNNRTEIYPLSQNEHLSIIKGKVTEYWNQYWIRETGITGKGLFLRSIRTKIKYNNTLFLLRNRRDQVVINRLRMGHVGVNSYLNRFGMAEEEFCQNLPCMVQGFADTIEHFLFHCPLYTSFRNELKANLLRIGVSEFNMKTILIGNENYNSQEVFICKYLIEYLRSTNRTRYYF